MTNGIPARPWGQLQVISLARLAVFGLLLISTACGGTEAAPAGEASPAASATETEAPLKGGVGSLYGYTGGTIGSFDNKPLVADARLRPEVQGFKFANYGNQYPQGDLTIEELRQMFGDKVCSVVLFGVCTPSPAAKSWMDAANSAMRSGHCEGMAVLSLKFLANKASPGTYDPSARNGYDLDPGDTTVLRQIAAEWSTQVLDPVKSSAKASRDRTPKEILDTLFQSMRDGGELYSLGMYQAGVGGHAVAPFAIADAGNGVYWLYVYDNNYPGQYKYVEFNTQANTWTYAAAAVNPSADKNPWRGDASSRSLDITPLSTRSGKYACPFCGGGSGSLGARLARPLPASASETQYMLNGRGEVVVQDAQGRRAGIVNGQIINEIPGADVVPLHGLFFYEGAPVVILPDGSPVDVQVTGSKSPSKAVALSVFRPGLAMRAGGVTLGAGQVDQLQIAPDGRRFSYRSGGKSKPTLQLALDNPGRDYLFIISGPEVDGDDSLTLGLNPDTGRLEFSTTEPGAHTYDLIIVGVDEDGAQIFAHNDLEVDDGGTALADFENWDEGEALDLGFDDDGDGALDRDTAVEDEDLSAMLDDAGGMSTEHLQDLLDEAGLYAAPEEVADLFDSADDPEGAFRALAGEVDPDELDAVMESLGFTPEEMEAVHDQLTQDTDGDFIYDIYDDDWDNDGVTNDLDADDDNDGIADVDDTDDDNDGVDDQLDLPTEGGDDFVVEEIPVEE